MSTIKDLPSFQRYQQAFSAYIRDPINQPRPKDVPVERIAVYEEIVFNNIFEAVSACFPVAQKVIGKAGWLKLVRAFLREYSANSPIFRKIPEEFLSFLATQKNLAPYIPSLCHYEWVELAVGSSEATVDRHSIDATGDLLEYQPAFVPAMQILNYEFAVHKISARNKPKETMNTQLLVYRNADDTVKFIELNNVTYRLIELLQEGITTGRQALTIIATELAHPQPENVIQFGLEILEDLRHQGIILGVYRSAMTTSRD
ncbi:MAG TPA: putative DNA-binding domain-containing protein [Methylotenera sp.]|nr:putative DNA-binding domain-containing protein [Methylotenera sp.]